MRILSMGALLLLGYAGSSWADQIPALRCNETTGFLCAEPSESIGYNGEYTGHDEPAVLFYSNERGSGNSMTYLLKLPKDPPTLPTQDGNGGTFNGSQSCVVNMTNNMRLGTMSGASATFGMWLVCDAVQSSELGSNMWQSLRQQAGWQNTISIGDNEPRDFYNATSAKTNVNAWLDQMSSGGRDAILATFSSVSVNDCWNVHNAAKLKGNVFNTPRNNGASCGGGQPGYFFCYSHRVN